MNILDENLELRRRIKAAEARVAELERELGTERQARGQDIRSMGRTIEQLNLDLERNKRLKIEAASDRDAANAYIDQARGLLERCRDALDTLMGDSDLDEDESPEALTMRAACEWLRAHPATPAATGAEHDCDDPDCQRCFHLAPLRAEKEAKGG